VPPPVFYVFKKLYKLKKVEADKKPDE